MYNFNYIKYLKNNKLTQKRTLIKEEKNLNELDNLEDMSNDEYLKYIRSSMSMYDARKDKEGKEGNELDVSLKDEGFINEDLKLKIKEQISSFLEAKKKNKKEEPKDDEEVELEDNIEDVADEDVNDDVDDPSNEFNNIDMRGENEGLSEDETQIQDSLKLAYDNALAIGDNKLAKQIGNTITMFTRSHIVKTNDGNNLGI